MESRSIVIQGPLDLRGTLRPLHGRFAEDGWWLTVRSTEGPASLRIRRTREELIGEAWGPGAGWMLARLPKIAGLHDDPALFRTQHPIVSELHRRNPGLRFARTNLVLDSLVIAICGQKVTGREAAVAIRGLYQEFSDPAPGPNNQLRLPPDPVKMAAAPYWVFHQYQLEKRRADVLRRVAERHDMIAELADETPQLAADVLKSFSGVGDWSVAETLAVSHGDPDQVSIGDFHIKHLVVHHLTGKDRGSDQEMLDLLEEFRPHRGRVVRLLHQLGHEPKFGPRMSPRDISRM